MGTGSLVLVQGLLIGGAWAFRAHGTQKNGMRMRSKRARALVRIPARACNCVHWDPSGDNVTSAQRATTSVFKQPHRSGIVSIKLNCVNTAIWVSSESTMAKVRRNIFQFWCHQSCINSWLHLIEYGNGGHPWLISVLDSILLQEWTVTLNTGAKMPAFGLGWVH